MAKDIPDYMRDFYMNIDYGFTAVESKPVETTQVVEQSSLEMSKLKSGANMCEGGWQLSFFSLAFLCQLLLSIS